MKGVASVGLFMILIGFPGLDADEVHACSRSSAGWGEALAPGNSRLRKAPSISETIALTLAPSM